MYRDRLRANCLRKEWTLEVEMTHLIGWREDLASRCRSEPGEVVPLVSLCPLSFAPDSYILTSLVSISTTVRSRAPQCREEPVVPDRSKRGRAPREAESGARNSAATPECQSSDAVPRTRCKHP